jgi:hypothetical protein
MGLFAAALIVSATASAAKAPVYILNGYSFGKMPGVNTAELEAKLKEKAGARITQADIAADEAIIAKELRARHVPGRLFTSLAEKHGRVWIIFDLIDTNRPTGAFGKPRNLDMQKFEGATRISAGALAAATGLKQGEPLSQEKLGSARKAIAAAYAKAMPGRVVTIKGKMQIKPDGKVTLTWIIGEPQ